VTRRPGGPSISPPEAGEPSIAPPEAGGASVSLAAMLHEIRQPLFAVKGRLQLALDQRGALDGPALREVIEHLGHLDDLLQRYAHGDPDGPASVIDLREEVRWALGLLAAQALEVGARVQLTLPPEPALIRARPVAVRQVVLNLARNALDAAAGGAAPQVWLEVRPEPDVVSLVVEDSGPGITPEIGRRLFEPFVTSKGPDHGTGLGLFIARRLTEELGGTLRAESGDRGACFVMRVPRA
jgi:two-component system, NtrC family, C4-dicarboxylate transport sensor histidine kinase DctB